MKIQSVHDKIFKLGGSAEIKIQRRGDRDYPYLEGVLNGYDVHMAGSYKGEIDYYTVRAIRNRNEYDMGADYNPGGHTFLRRVKDLEKAANEWESGE